MVICCGVCDVVCDGVYGGVTGDEGNGKDLDWGF